MVFQETMEVDENQSGTQSQPSEGFVARLNNYKIIKQFFTAINVNRYCLTFSKFRFEVHFQHFELELILHFPLKNCS